MLLHDELKEFLPESFNLMGLAIGVIERELNHFLTSSYEVEENSGDTRERVKIHETTSRKTPKDIEPINDMDVT
ncbi:hypothetical protein CEXT_225281 [Caerostris extrusa]|uniref:Uncharacterized protein n=1 Tax=Caerostris extrusa TaxID=172846 RepID=A0AAV4NAT4_CAEEX|nr:hypothetical protein CEXT_225281 [Caerostris extrusa]